jgi:hypothetical protein
MTTHFNSYEFRTVTPVTVLPPKPTQVSPAIAARMQELALRMAPLMKGGMDFDTAYAQAFCELAAPKRKAERDRICNAREGSAKGGAAQGIRRDLDAGLIDAAIGNEGKTAHGILMTLRQGGVSASEYPVSRALQAGVESGRLVAESKAKTVIYRRAAV